MAASLQLQPDAALPAVYLAWWRSSIIKPRSQNFCGTGKGDANLSVHLIPALAESMAFLGVLSLLFI